MGVGGDWALGGGRGGLGSWWGRGGLGSVNEGRSKMFCMNNIK